ncbi:MAG: hypothetical protein ACP5OG_01675 [Candidatus Nanoarchaeia archaeon]
MASIIELNSMKKGQSLNCAYCNKELTFGIDEIHFISEPISIDEDIEFIDFFHPICKHCFEY